MLWDIHGGKQTFLLAQGDKLSQFHHNTNMDTTKNVGSREKTVKIRCKINKMRGEKKH